MKRFCWDVKKNERLKAERGITFEEVVSGIERGGVLDIMEHPNQDRYGGQRLFVLDIRDYAYLVPFIETEGEVILKTAIPSRKATRKHLRGGS